MKRLYIFSIVLIFAGVLLSYQSTPAYWDLPPLPSSAEYGNILINRVSSKNNVKPATFSHWSHRLHYTCNACHLELEFTMKLNTTEITEEANKAGKFCGACHNGKIAFSHEKENCDKCHNADIRYGSEKFEKLGNFPRTDFGNKIDWTGAINTGLIKPKKFVSEETPLMSLDKTIELKSYMFIPPVIFPHLEHTSWLDCSNCHPDIFNIKKRTTQNFSMAESIKGKFCGVCHLKIAFPFNDCQRCHPGLDNK